MMNSTHHDICQSKKVVPQFLATPQKNSEVRSHEFMLFEQF